MFLTTREVKVLDIGQEQVNMQKKLYATKLLDKLLDACILLFFCLVAISLQFHCDKIVIDITQFRQYLLGSPTITQNSIHITCFRS